MPGYLISGFRRALAGLALCAGVLAADCVQAAYDVTISSKPDNHMSCSGGACTATGKNAILSVTTLENLLASGNVSVNTGSAGIQTGDIAVRAALSWVNASTLTLDAFHSIVVNQPVSIAGSGGLTLKTDDGGTGGSLSFGKFGNATFLDLADSLVINGNAYVLAGDIETLASDVAVHAAGFYALANNYNAKPDGTYKTNPIATTFTGYFEGLGHSISNLTINTTCQSTGAGLFSEPDGAIIENIGLKNVNVRGCGYVGALVARLQNATIANSYSTGSVSGSGGGTGGLVGISYGTTLTSFSTCTINVIGRTSNAGGLVGYNDGEISNSYATGPVSDIGSQSAAGGLSGSNAGVIYNSYATGSVSNSGTQSRAGGLVGYNGFEGRIGTSYSTGAVSGGHFVGGLLGSDASPGGNVSSAYWDTTTSGVTNLSQGAGSPANDFGIAGLNSSELQAELPAGFDPSVWAEKSTLNAGLPYLISNPPR